MQIILLNIKAAKWAKNTNNSASSLQLYIHSLSAICLFPCEKPSTFDAAQGDAKLQEVQFIPGMMASTVFFPHFTNPVDI